MIGMVDLFDFVTGCGGKGNGGSGEKGDGNERKGVFRFVITIVSTNITIIFFIIHTILFITMITIVFQ